MQPLHLQLLGLVPTQAVPVLRAVIGDIGFILFVGILLPPWHRGLAPVQVTFNTL